MGKGYIAAAETVNAAKTRQLSVGDYLEEIWQIKGSRQQIMNNLVGLGVFKKCNSVLEIGPGSGMFLEKTLAAGSPSHYEIYEIATDWIEYLLSEYANRIVIRPTDGKTLSPTPSASIDLVQAHGVFVYLNFLNSYSYFLEIARVVKPGGFAVFDLFDELCLTDAITEKWLQSTDDYPSFLGREYIIDFFRKRGFTLNGNFFRVYGAGKAHYYVFQKQRESLIMADTTGIKAAITCFFYAMEISPTIHSLCSYLSDHGWQIDIYVETLFRETDFKFLRAEVINLELSGDMHYQKECLISFLKGNLAGYDVIFAVDFLTLDLLHQAGIDLAKVVFLSFEGIDYFAGFDPAYVARLISSCAFSTIQSRARQNTIETYLKTSFDCELLPVSLRPIKPQPKAEKTGAAIKLVYSGYLAPWACLTELIECFSHDLGVNYQLLLHGHAIGTEPYLKAVRQQSGRITGIKIDTSYYRAEQYPRLIAPFDLGIALYQNPGVSGNFENLIFASGKIATYLWNGLAVLTNIDDPLTHSPPFLLMTEIDAKHLKGSLVQYARNRELYHQSALALAQDKYNFDYYMNPILIRLVKQLLS